MADNNKKSKRDESVDSVFLRNQRKLKSYISKFLDRPQDVEDIVQDVYLKAYEAQAKTHIKKPLTYMYTIARNLSFNHTAKHANKITDYIADLGLLDVLDLEDEVGKEAISQEKFLFFCEAVRELPVQCRRVFILKKVYGLTNKEVADRLGISISTVNQHLAKGLARCVSYMRSHGYLE